MPERPADPQVQTVIENYRRVVGAFDEMFKAMRPRIAEELWRVDGIGSCCIGKSESEEGFEKSIVQQEIIDLREARNEQSPGKRYGESEACPYHRVDQGCVLGDLKSPKCIQWLDSPWEFDKRFGFSGNELRRYISKVLETILAGQGTEELVESACEYARATTEYVLEFPLLTPTEIDRGIRFMGGKSEQGLSVIRESLRRQMPSLFK